MTLFGKKNKKHIGTDATTAPAGGQHNVYDDNYNNDPNVGGRTGGTAINNTQLGQHHDRHHGSAGSYGDSNTRDYGMGGPNTGAKHQDQGQGCNDFSNTNGAYTNQSSTGTGGSNFPPAGTINDGARGGGPGDSTIGRVEQAVGSMVGSQALKEKGFQKEQEASAYKAQGAEIAEAERLEREALMRRERAVAHGAHPDNKYLGGRQGGQSLGSDTYGEQD